MTILPTFKGFRSRRTSLSGESSIAEGQDTPMDPDTLWEWRVRTCESEQSSCYTNLRNLGFNPELNSNYNQVSESFIQLKNTRPNSVESLKFFDSCLDAIQTMKTEIRGIRDARMKEEKLSECKKDIFRCETKIKKSGKVPSEITTWRELLGSIGILQITDPSLNEFEHQYWVCKKQAEAICEELEKETRKKMARRSHAMKEGRRDSVMDD